MYVLARVIWAYFKSARQRLDRFLLIHRCTVFRFLQAGYVKTSSASTPRLNALETLSCAVARNGLAA